MDSLLRIVVGEQEYKDKPHIISQWIRNFLWEKGFPGLTIRRGEMSIDYHSSMHSFVLEDVEFNNIAIILESVADSSKIESVKQELINNIPHGQVSVLRGMEEKDMEKHDYFVVKVYTNEENSWFKKEEYQKVLSFFQNKNVIWASVTKGIVGYGKSRVVHNQKVFSLSKKMPIVIECIVPSEHLKELLDELKVIVEEGAVFTTPVDVVINK